MTDLPPLVGHELAWSGLRDSRPPVLLLLGPQGTGKWLLAQHLADSQGYPRQDTFWSQVLDMDVAGTVQAFLRTAGVTPQGKLVILDLDGASAAAQNALLKTLEEPPGRARFILVASEPPLPTVVSRSHVTRCGVLSTREVAYVLRRLGMDDATAEAAAAVSGGRVSTGLAHAGAAKDAVPQVQAAVQAAARGDTAALGRVFALGWGEAHHALLARWAAEAVTGRWLVFGESDAPPHAGAYVLRMLSDLSDARPALLDRAVMSALAASRAQ
jgi:replication-associated recombination protein RarA